MKVLINERLSEHKYKTPEGYLICVDAILARTGKQEYRRAEVFGDSCKDSDDVIQIDRKEEEVFSPQTLASFENKPITVEHPDVDVNSDNYKDYAVGFVRDVKRGVADGQDVILGTLVITDRQTIEEIEDGEHTDLSCGYDCDIVDEENPQQRNIRGNHVALCQQGRAGIARIVDSADSLKDGSLNITPTKEPGQDKVIYTMQSDVSDLLYFYIGKTYSMKDGEWTYIKYKMNGTTPEQLRDELKRNGWHLVNKGPASFIDSKVKDEDLLHIEVAEVPKKDALYALKQKYKVEVNPDNKVAKEYILTKDGKRYIVEDYGFTKEGDMVFAELKRVNDSKVNDNKYDKYRKSLLEAETREELKEIKEEIENDESLSDNELKRLLRTFDNMIVTVSDSVKDDYFYSE